MQRSHKIKLRPTKTQEVLLWKTAGVSRYAYNWGLEKWNEQYELYKEGKAEKPHAIALCAKWTQEKPEWAKEVDTSAQTRAIMNVGKAWHNYWNKKTKQPTFHKRGSHCSFYAGNSKAYTEGKIIHLPRIGKVRMREALRFDGKVMSYTVSQQAGQWWVSIQVEMQDAFPSANESVVGVDVGIKSLAVASDGTTLDNPKLMPKNQSKLKYLQRKLSRQKKGSNRRKRTQLRIAKTHLKMTDTRTDAIHKFTSALAKNHGHVVLETLDIASMLTEGPKWIRKGVHDAAMREVHRQLEYKTRVTKAPPFYRSSKTCSNCGAVKAELPLSCRTYKCEHCGHVQDRDLNAACNLKNMRWVTAQDSTQTGRTPGKKRITKTAHPG